MRAALSLSLSLSLFSFTATVQAAPIDGLPNFDGSESFEGITAATPNVSYYAPAKVLTYSADLLLPSGLTLAYLGQFGTVICNYAVGSPTTSMGANGSIASANDVAYGSAYANGNNGKVRLAFPQGVVAAGAYVTGSMGSVTITAFDAANNAIETRTKATVAVPDWKNNFAGIVDPAGTIRAIEVTGELPVVDEVRFLTAFRSLNDSVPEPPGANCVSGGVRVISGPDTNANGVLETSEIVSSAYACFDSDGANSLVSVTDEPPGTNCPNGGKKIEKGADTDNDARLDAGEVTATTYVCNGTDGGIDRPPGAKSLISVTIEAAGTNCPSGGRKIEAGVDTDADGELDAGEVTATTYVCNDADGPDGAGSAAGPGGDSGCSATPGVRVSWELGIILAVLPLYRRRRAAVPRR